MADMKQSISPKSILVIGDAMLDIYYYGGVDRISPEAPVPVFKREGERIVLGGAGNVAVNLAAANQRVSLMALTGRDSYGDKLRELCSYYGIDTRFLLQSEKPTTVKTRFLAERRQQVLRVDMEDARPIDDETAETALSALESGVRDFDLLIVSDYMKGLLTETFMRGLFRIADSAGVPALVDVKDARLKKYKGAFLLKPNLLELRRMTGMPAQSKEEIIEASAWLAKACECQYVLTTCGARGMALVRPETERVSDAFWVNSTGHEVYDVTGAGDTAIAYLGACLANRFPIREAVRVANYAAGVQVSKVGASAVYLREVEAFYSGVSEALTHKILNAGEIANFREKHANQTIVFTNGCFDIPHVGHIRYLREAAKLGDVLVVGLNSDASVRRLKGAERPVNRENDRAEMLCAFGFVDYVAIFGEDTPLNLIRAIQPDVLVKGGDYTEESIVGADFVRARGGNVVVLPYVEGKSTTKIVERIRLSGNGDGNL